MQETDWTDTTLIANGFVKKIYWPSETGIIWKPFWNRHAKYGFFVSLNLI